MNELGLIFGIISLILGFFYYFIVPRAGPNVFIGFRFGYTMADERVWRKSNKYLGKLLFLEGIIILVLSFYIVEEGIMGLIFLLAYVLATIATMLKSKEYADQILGYLPREEKVVKPIEPLKIPTLPKYIMLSAYLLGIILVFVFYFFGPDTIPAHFGPSGRPDLYVSKQSFMLAFLTAFTVIFAASWIIEFIGYKYPMFLHAGRLSKKWGRDVLFRVIYYTLMVNEAFGFLALLDIFIYLKYGTHIIFNPYGIMGVAILAFLPYAAIIYRRLQYKE
ncbi:MAG: SdpI family protein [Candidatus Njordarchaeia archaeon]